MSALSFNSGRFVCVLCFSLFLALIPAIFADQVTITPSADTSLMEVTPNNNNGALPWVNAGTTQNGPRAHGLFQFDVASQIPAGSTITAVTLKFEVVGQPGCGYDIPNMGFYRMLQPWGEGNKTYADPRSPGQGAPASLGEATWTHRFAGTDQTWAAPGGAPGVDFTATPSVQEYIYAVIFSPYFFPSTDAFVADVQSMLDHPESNYGWMLKAESEDAIFTARRYGSREGLAPQLMVDFVPVPEPQAIFLFVAGGGLLLGTRRFKRF